MVFTLAMVAIGTILILMALAGSVLKRLPLTTSLLYLFAGVILGPAALGLIQLDAIRHSALLERLTEVAVLISLFTSGLKLRLPLREKRWWLPVRLASVSMLVTVGLVALAGYFGLGLPLGAAVLLGAILAPTDPVLASEVQVEDPTDRDRLRFSLTGEAGLNDGSAFPMVMLGLGLLGHHQLGASGWLWLSKDLVYATVGGLAIGTLLGCLVARLVLYLRTHHREAVGLDEFLTLGLIALSCGLASLAQTYAFLAVFAAGLAFRQVEMRATDNRAQAEASAETEPVEQDNLATDPEKAPAYMAQAVLGFNEQLERITEVGTVVILGALLSWKELPWDALWFVPVLFLLIRPASVMLGLVGTHTSPLQRSLIGWFGIRGLGSLYYLMYAIQHGLEPELASRLTAITLMVVTCSIVGHGLSVTPLMKFYTARNRPRAVA